MEKIIIFLKRFRNTYAYIFNKNDDILNLKDEDLKILNDNNLILNGVIKNPSEILELWDIQSISFVGPNKLDKKEKITTIKINLKFKLRLRKNT